MHLKLNSLSLSIKKTTTTEITFTIEIHVVMSLVLRLIANFMDMVKTMYLSCMNILLNNAVVFANIQTSAL